VIDNCLFLFADNLNDEAPHARVVVEVEENDLLPRSQAEATVYDRDL
jgi:hypothetical protein